MTPALLLAVAALAAPAYAGDPSTQLIEAFGPGFEPLRKAGLVVVHGKPGDWRLQAVDWRGLGELSKRAKAVESLESAYQALGQGGPLSKEERPAFMALADLPARYPMTPGLHALVAALGGYHSEWRALAGGSDLPPAAPKENLFATSWGKKFAARTHADRVEDSTALAKPFFEQVLAALRPEPGAREHFLSWVSDRHNTDAAPVLERDLTAGLASEELRGWLRKYLLEERRRLQLSRYRLAVKVLERQGLARDLADLTAVTRPLAERPGLLGEMEAWPKAPQDGPAKLKSVGLHVPQPVKLGQHEMGDTLTITGGYWVDGLAENATVQVEETTFVEDDYGFSHIESKTAARRNGGPYPIARKLTLSASDLITLRAAVSVPGASFSDKVEAPISRDYETAVRKLAVADQRSMLCDFKAAEAAYSELEQSLADAAREKKQYKDLIAAASLRRGQAARRGGELAKLEELIAASRPDASPDRCEYDEKNTVLAIGRVRALPAGCDKLLPDLEKQLALIRRRRADQDLFGKLVSQARGRRSDCSFIPASESFASALAVLDADPAARCGKTAVLAEQVEKELPASRAELHWREAYDKELNKAESEVSPQKRLALLRPVLARISGSPAPQCFSAQRKRAETLLSKAADALISPEPSEVERVLPKDAGLSETVGAVAGARRAIVSANESMLERRAEEQGPAAVQPPEGSKASAPEQAPKKTAVKPAPKKAAGKKAKKEGSR